MEINKIDDTIQCYRMMMIVREGVFCLRIDIESVHYASSDRKGKNMPVEIKWGLGKLRGNASFAERDFFD